MIRKAFTLLYCITVVFTPLLLPAQVTDIDNNTYQTVVIGTQEWMAENLKTTRYSNGDNIDNITDNATWTGLTTGAYCWYNNDQATYGSTYGALYNWYAVDDSRNVCPTGWRLASDSDWNKLAKYLDSTTDTTLLDWVGTDIGNQLKAISFPNGTNSSGFSALPGGYRTTAESFIDITRVGYWWTITENDADFSYMRHLHDMYSGIFRQVRPKAWGLSVRCIKDTNNGLVAYYPFNNSGNDESGNGNTATPGNYIQQGTDRFGGTTAYLFNGTDDYFWAPPSTSTDFTGEISVCAWVNPSVVNIEQQTISSKGGGWNRAGWLLTLNNDKVRWHLGNGGSEGMFDTQTSVPANKWSFIVAQWKDGVMNVYINGIKDQNSASWASGLVANSYYHYIGMNDYINFYFNGNIDDMRIYNRALTADEIKELYHEGGWSTVTDIDGNVYPTVKIGEQEWMASNLKTTKYSNGEAINNITDNSTWAGLSTGAYCWYNNDYDNNGSVYGALYNWYAVVDSRNICPTEWHVPSDAEWTILETHLGGYSVAGGKMKEAGTSHWANPNTGADNSSGFTALPGGFRYDVGTWNELGNGGYFYTSSVYNETYVIAKFLNYSNTELNSTALDKRYGSSIRCIKNGQPPTLLTTAIQYATSRTAKAGGEVTSDGGGDIYNRGIIWGYDTNLSESSHVGIVYDTATGVGTFQVILEPLTPQTTYYYRAFAINSSGWGYGPLYSFNSLAEMNLCDALDNCDISFENGGSSTWFGQHITTHDGVDAAQSGFLIDNQHSYLHTTLAGPGELSFYWKTSSQYDSDFFQFYVDGTFIEQISGETDWYQVNHTLTEGSHYILLQYIKDYAGSEGQDCGWIDQVVYTQAGYATVTTNSVYDITSNTAMVGASVTSDGGNYVSQRGVIWATFENPSFSNYHSYTNNGEGTGDFVALIDGLNANTTYYVRSYAINSTGTSYGNQLQFTTLPEGETVTDIDGNVYPVITIGDQFWMAKNLRVTHYRNGDAILTDLSSNQWTTITIGAFSIYPHENINGLNSDAEVLWAYGALYNWYTIYDSRGLCPDGWRVPDDTDWTALKNYLGGEEFAGGLLKSTREEPDDHPRWNSPNTNATDSYGFSALPGGFRYYNGNYGGLGVDGFLWINHEVDQSNALGIHMYYEHGEAWGYNGNKREGFSVRCIKDQNLPSVTTNYVSNIGPSSATVSSTVTADNGYSVTQRGVVISYSYQNPSVEQNEGYTIDGSGTGMFESNLYGILSNTTYYVRAYATNENGTGYGNQLEFTTTEPGVYTLSFMLDMTNAMIITDEETFSFDPAIHRVFISGNFGEEDEFWPQPGSVDKYELFPVDKSKANKFQSKEQEFYSISITLTEKLFEYKFFIVLDAPTWQYGEWSGGANRGFYLNYSQTQNHRWGAFNASSTIVKIGETIEFQNANLYNVSDWLWSFGPGANPSEYSQPGPVNVSYSNMGQKTVTLKIKYYDVDIYYTKENYITVGNAPAISSITESEVNYTSANINFTVNPNWLETTVRFDYGETESLGNTINLPETYYGDINHGIDVYLDELDENKTYYYQIVAGNALGETITDIIEFRTACSYTITATTPSGLSNVCAGATEVYTTTSSNAESYAWELTPASAGSFSSTSNSVSVQWNQGYNGDAQIRVRGISGSCNSPWSSWKNVYVNISVSDVVISGEESVCSGSEVMYTLNRNAVNYQWQASGGGGVVLNSNNRGAIIKWNNSGSGVVRVVEQGTNCPLVSSFSTTIRTNVAPNKPEIHKKGTINILICKTPNMNYKWFRDNQSLPDDSQYIIARNNLGLYNVQIKDNNSCPNTSNIYNLSTYTKSEPIVIYPNPSSGQFSMEVMGETLGSAIITITNSFGKTIYTEITSKTEYLLEKSINLPNLPEGLYIISVRVGEDEPTSAKLTIY